MKNLQLGKHRIVVKLCFFFRKVQNAPKFGILGTFWKEKYPNEVNKTKNNFFGLQTTSHTFDSLPVIFHHSLLLDSAGLDNISLRYPVDDCHAPCWDEEPTIQDVSRNLAGQTGDTGLDIQWCISIIQFYGFCYRPTSLLWKHGCWATAAVPEKKKKKKKKVIRSFEQKVNACMHAWKLECYWTIMSTQETLNPK